MHDDLDARRETTLCRNFAYFPCCLTTGLGPANKIQKFSNSLAKAEKKRGTNELRRRYLEGLNDETFVGDE